MNGWTARLVDDPATFVRNAVLLLVTRPRGEGATEVLLRDGTTYVFTDPHVDPPPDPERAEVGVLVPFDSVDAIAEALDVKAGRVDRRLLEQRIDFLEAMLAGVVAERDRLGAAVAALVGVGAHPPTAEDVFRPLNPRGRR